MAPTPSKVKQYTESELNLSDVAEKAFQVFGQHPFQWQLESAKHILCGRDVILDVGTGCGKTLCFLLPLLLHENDIALIICPLSALMLEQANKNPLPTIAVCQETLASVGSDQVYEDIVCPKFRQVLVSPEIAISSDFHQKVFAKTSFTDHLRVICIDEAHCISIWGGTFRPDYSNLGVIRGKLPKNVPFEVASATLPEHILDDIRSKLRLSKDAHSVSVTNARPNVALSVRVMKHSMESKGDLRFIIPPGAIVREDIPITLVYCNQRSATEICADRAREWAGDCRINPDCIAFYHALVGPDRKRDIERQLAAGDIRILFCTTALGMGCDLRNIARVVLWGLPTSFCGLVQEAGRAGRDLDTESEAILIIPKGLAKEKASYIEASVAQSTARMALEGEALARQITEEEVDHTLIELDDEGIRVEEDASDSEQAAPSPDFIQPHVVVKRHKRYGQESNTFEAKALKEFALTSRCRCIVWDQFFSNADKLPLVYQVTSNYQQKPGQRCCDNCQPDRFPQEVVTATRVEKGVKRGKKKQTAEEEVRYITNKLQEWRDDELIELCYPGLIGIAPETVMSDDIIKGIATCGKRVREYSELRQYVRWLRGHDTQSNGPNSLGKLLMDKLDEIYRVLDDHEAHVQGAESGLSKEEMVYRKNVASSWSILTAESFCNHHD